jgi:hypothetical protein
MFTGDTTDEFLAVSDDTGAFASKPITVPDDAPPGQHWVTAVERDNGDAAQALFTVRTDWPGHGFNARGKRFNIWENVISPSNADKLETAWTFTANGAVQSSPAVVNGILYFGSADGNLYALDATYGTFKWSYATQGPIDYSSPTAAGGIVYVGSSDHNVYALNATTGAFKWSYTTGGPISSSPTVSGGTVYIASNDGSVYALNATTGAKIWSALTTTNAAIVSAPAVADGLVYVGSGDHSVYAFDAATGAKRWSFPTNDVVASSPAATNGMLYIGSNDRNIWGRNARTAARTPPLAPELLFSPLLRWQSGMSMWAPRTALSMRCIISVKTKPSSSTGNSTQAARSIPRPPLPTALFTSDRMPVSCTASRHRTGVCCGKATPAAQLSPRLPS